MTIREALTRASGLIRDSDSPWLDATVLLGAVTGMSREKLLASFPDPLSEELYISFMQLIEKRREGFPVAYLTGQKEFYGRPFKVTEGILCPRPDTEILVEGALKQILERGYRRVHDLCTGSGCIALTLALEEPELQVSASDISTRSEEIFQKNCRLLDEEGIIPPPAVRFIRTSLLDDIPPPLDMIVTNPPYLTTDETDERMDGDWKEPALALDGGPDGLDLIRIIIPEAYNRLVPGGCLMIEAAPPQMPGIRELMEEAGFSNIWILQDLAYRDRVMGGIKPV